MSTAHRPRRSCLYMPGANARALEKARELPADTLILDLEDAVAPEAKGEARGAIAAALAAGGYGKRELVVRMNGLDSEWGHADLEMAVKSGAAAVLAPKVTGVRDIERLDAALKKAGAGEGFALWVMIETPLAILNIKEIAAASTGSHLTTFVMGTNDLAKEYRARMTPDRLALQTALQLSVAAARAYGLTAIDGVYNDIKNEDGFRHECEQGRDLGQRAPAAQRLVEGPRRVRLSDMPRAREVEALEIGKHRARHRRRHARPHARRPQRAADVVEAVELADSADRRVAIEHLC